MVIWFLLHQMWGLCLLVLPSPLPVANQADEVSSDWTQGAEPTSGDGTRCQHSMSAQGDGEVELAWDLEWI